jgi:hypothetical protein
MSTLTVHPHNEAQEQALKAFFEAFNVQYEKDFDETEYLTVSKANKTALDESIQQLNEGKGVKVSLEDLWK